MAFGTGTSTCFLWFLDIIHSSTPQHRVVEYRVSGSGFTAYAILGNDIVIGDAKVAAMCQKGVAISDDSDLKSSDFKL